ncbi:hypothetical protein BpHYR1_040513 [Brachionus plicatilis]|uniref:Uncharacterized protein n=1 Tax=Brachionus plicatilis TaxID=10195 RepID=A0A3M7T190_BRAPC|nr:hypothetical protein BpHYR1_040513 [Brachionus plicatilis]
MIYLTVLIALGNECFFLEDHLRESIFRLFDTNIDTNHAMSKSIRMRSYYFLRLLPDRNGYLI